MEKIKGIIDRCENDCVVIRSDGEDFVFPGQFFSKFSEGDSVSIAITVSKNRSNARKKASKLIFDVLKDE